MARLPNVLAGSDSLLPDGGQVLGGNIAPTAAEVAEDTIGWEPFWRNWNWTRIAFQIDLHAAIGSNAIRTMSTLLGPLTTSVPRATVLSRWTQFINYAASKGLYVYPCAAWEAPAGVYTDQQLIDEVVALGQHFHTFDNIIGFDIIQESSMHEDRLTVPFRQTATTAVRQVTDLPLTWSITGGAPFNGETFALNRVKDYVDFIDIHVYEANYTPPEYQTALNNYYLACSLPFIIGETGQNQSATAAARALRYQGSHDVANEVFAGNGRSGMGMMQWATLDQGTTSGGQWGMWNENGTPRTEMTDLWPTFARGAGFGQAVAANAQLRLNGQARTAKLLVSGVDRGYAVQAPAVP